MRAAISRCRPSLAHRRTLGRQHFPYFPYGHPHASQSRRRRTEKLQLPLQAHDHGRRTDRAGSLEVVLRSVGKSKAAIVDTWWQTETGGFLCSTKPALDLMKPGSTGPAVLGIYPIIWDEEGKEVKAGSGNAGNICIRNPWPGIMQTIWGDPQRFVAQYYKKYNKNPKSKDWRDWPYYAADGAVLSADGYYR